MTSLSRPRRFIRTAASIGELLGPASHRVPYKTADSLSGSNFEQVEIDGIAYVLKYLCVDDDWIMRASGDLHCRQLRFWRSDEVARLPECIDPAMVGCADYDPAGKHPGGALLLRDVSPWLVSTAAPIPMAQHHRFLEHMAALHAAFWGWQDDIGLNPLAHNYTILTPLMASIERERGGRDSVPPLVERGWQALDDSSPTTAAIVRQLLADPGPLVDRLQATPQTLIHGDWKCGNLGSAEDGSTILLDWDRVGAGPGCFDLAWYLAVNCDLFPGSKEDAIDHYRSALEAHGIATAAWWAAQLEMALLGGFLMLGWSKSEGDAAELRWWEARVLEASERL